MSTARIGARKRCVLYLQVTDPEGNLLGRVLDISAEGLQLIHDATFRAGQVLDLRVTLPAALKQPPLEAWCGGRGRRIRRASG